VLDKEKQLRILRGLYERMQEGIEFTTASLGFEGREGSSEAAYHLSNLKRQGLVEIGHKAFSTGGQENKQYENRIVLIWWEEVQLTHLGEGAVKYN
jgi:hypothetical protein